MYFDTLPTVIWRINQTRLLLFSYDWLSEPSIQPDLVVVVPTGSALGIRTRPVTILSRLSPASGLRRHISAGLHRIFILPR